MTSGPAHRPSVPTISEVGSVGQNSQSGVLTNNLAGSLNYVPPLPPPSDSTTTKFWFFKKTIYYIYKSVLEWLRKILYYKTFKFHPRGSFLLKKKRNVFWRILLLFSDECRREMYDYNLKCYIKVCKTKVWH